MREVDGFAFLAVLRRDPTTATLPVIVWTAADPSPSERARLLALAQAIVPKAGGLRPLVEEIQKAMSAPPSRPGSSGDAV
jgi:CheY-like chemotaxis protein